MKITTINQVAGILSGMKLNKITDKAVKTTLVNDFLSLRRIVKEADAERMELVKKFQEDWADELEAVEAFRLESRPVEGHDAYLDAEHDANVVITSIFDRDADVVVKSVPMDVFLASCGGEELTMEQIAILIDAGVVAE